MIDTTIQSEMNLCLQKIENMTKKRYTLSLTPLGASEEDIKRALGCGALCYFTKPSLYSELVQELQLVVTHLENGDLEGLGAASKAFIFSTPF